MDAAAVHDIFFVGWFVLFNGKINPRRKGFAMRRVLVALAVLVALGSPAWASGLLIPVEKKLPPLALVDQKVTIDIVEQVATTRIEQSFRNHTGRELEATYL